MMKLGFLTLLAAAATAGQLPPLEARGRVAGYFFAGSAVHDQKAPGGFAPSANRPRRIERSVAAGKLSLTALVSEPVAFAGAYQGFRVILANETDRTIWFNASDSRLNIVREALDSAGRWKPVEYLPSSWCGNSYHRVALPSDHNWSFAAPVFSGGFKTRMRFTLSDKDLVIHSNEFEGIVDPQQFERDEFRPSGGIMDPYSR